MKSQKKGSESQEVEGLRDRLNKAYTALADAQTARSRAEEELKEERAKPKGISDAERSEAYQHGAADASAGNPRRDYPNETNECFLDAYNRGYNARLAHKCEAEIDRLQHQLTAVTKERDEAKAVVVSDSANINILNKQIERQNVRNARLWKLVAAQAAHIAGFEYPD